MITVAHDNSGHDNRGTEPEPTWPQGCGECGSVPRKTFHQAADERNDIGQEAAPHGEVARRVRVKSDVDALEAGRRDFKEIRQYGSQMPGNAPLLLPRHAPVGKLHGQIDGAALSGRTRSDEQLIFPVRREMHGGALPQFLACYAGARIEEEIINFERQPLRNLPPPLIGHFRTSDSQIGHAVWILTRRSRAVDRGGSRG